MTHHANSSTGAKFQWIKKITIFFQSCPGVKVVHITCVIYSGQTYKDIYLNDLLIHNTVCLLECVTTGQVQLVLPQSTRWYHSSLRGYSNQLNTSDQEMVMWKQNIARFTSNISSNTLEVHFNWNADIICYDINYERKQINVSRHFMCFLLTNTNNYSLLSHTTTMYASSLCTKFLM
jgi:hypothetical protein